MFGPGSNSGAYNSSPMPGNRRQDERLKNYELWKKFCSKNKSIFPIKRKLNKNIVPWLYPVYIKNKNLRIKEIPIQTFYRDEHSSYHIKYSTNFLREIFTYR